MNNLGATSKMLHSVFEVALTLIFHVNRYLDV